MKNRGIILKQTFIVMVLVTLILSCKSLKPQEQLQSEDWWLWDASWNSSGDLIAAGGTQDTLRLFSYKDKQLFRNYPLEGTVTKIKWHPSDDKIAIAMQGGKTKTSIVFPAVGSIIELDSLDDAGARAIGWNSTGTLLAVGDYGGFLTIFNEQGKILKRIQTKQKGLIGLDWHPHKDIIVAVGEFISIYDYENDTLKSIRPREEEVLMLCVDWHPDGDLFVTGDYGDFIKDYPPLLQFWSAGGEKIRDIQESKAEYRNIRWSSDGRYLATASDFIGLWTKGGDLVNEKKVDQLIWGINWNKANTHLITAHDKGGLFVWDANLRSVAELKY